MDIRIIEVENESKSKVVALAMPERLRQNIRREAFERDLSFSAMIRLILEEHYSKKEGK